MNDYYSIELKAEEIVDARTKKYFAEVYGCYTAGYYRSAVVMLWSVAVTDILFKIQTCAEVYDDPKARSILKAIDEMRQKNIKSSEWEGILVRRAHESMKLFDISVLSFLESLQRHRNLSAHPVLKEKDVLFAPNKDTTRAHIRNILDGILTKHPLMTREILDTLLIDAREFDKLKNPYYFLDDDLQEQADKDLKRYIEAKYFKYLSPKAFHDIFRSLWRITFKSMDEEASKNRLLTSRLLNILFTIRQMEFTEQIGADPHSFGEISVDDEIFKLLTEFLCKYPKVFPNLGETIKIPLETYKNINLDNFARCIFMSDSPQEHLDIILKRCIENHENLDHRIFNWLKKNIDMEDKGISTCLMHIGIRLYCRSYNFDTADWRFKYMIKPFLQTYDHSLVVSFLSDCTACENSQVFNRYGVKHDHLEIKKIIDEKFPDISLDEHRKFRRSIGL